MKKIIFLSLVFISLNTYALADEDQKQETSDPPYSAGEIAWDIGIGIASSAAGGVAAASGNVPGAIVGIANGAKNFLNAAHKYNENIEYERENNRDDDDDDQE
jgi:hypothetical protein